MDIVDSIQPIWKVFTIGLILGAGLPALFAIGIHFGADHSVGDETVVRARTGGRIISWICFAIVGAAILFGLAVLVDAKDVLPAVGLG